MQKSVPCIQGMLDSILGNPGNIRFEFLFFTTCLFEDFFIIDGSLFEFKKNSLKPIKLCHLLIFHSKSIHTQMKLQFIFNTSMLKVYNLTHIKSFMNPPTINYKKKLFSSSPCTTLNPLSPLSTHQKERSY
jgi:hypothetical protein